LIAHTVVGGGEAAGITFLPLDSPDFFAFLGLVGQQSLLTGTRKLSGYSCSRLPVNVENFQMCLPVYKIMAWMA